MVITYPDMTNVASCLQYKEKNHALTQTQHSTDQQTKTKQNYKHSPYYILSLLHFTTRTSFNSRKITAGNTTGEGDVCEIQYTSFSLDRVV